jgi:hypothetical protein
MKAFRLTLSLALSVPCLALLGMFAVDTYFPAWGGAHIGGTLGAFCGLALGGALPRSVADWCFGQEDAEASKVKGWGRHCRPYDARKPTRRWASARGRGSHGEAGGAAARRGGKGKCPAEGSARRGNDILIGGYTGYDHNDAALWAIMAEWTSADSFAQRVAYLSDAKTADGFANRHNGDYFLVADLAVFNDATKDSLNGSGGSDWLFDDAADKITGLTKSDDLTVFS